MHSMSIQLTCQSVEGELRSQVRYTHLNDFTDGCVWLHQIQALLYYIVFSNILPRILRLRTVPTRKLLKK